MKTLLRYLKDNRVEAVLSPLFKFLEALLELFVPLLMASMIDQGIANRDGAHVLRMCAALLGLAVVGLASSITAQYFAAKVAVSFGAKVKQALFAHIMRFSYTDLDSLGTSALINRMTTDSLQAQTGVNMTLRLLLRSPLIVFGAIFMAFTVNAEAAMVFVPLIVLLSITIFAVMALTLPQHKRIQGRLDQLFLHTRETLTGVRVVRAFGLEEESEQRFAEENELFLSLQRRVGRISTLMNPLTFAFVNGALVALLWNGAVQVQDGTLTQGTVIALVNYLLQILVELIKLANLLVTITRALASAKRIEAVLLQEPSMELPESPLLPDAQSEEAIRFDNVCFQYQGAGENSLDDISFTALRGETIGIIGGTGSGKSTLAQLIPRFYDATEGCVRVCGADVKQQDRAALRAACAVVPQKALLFSGTIRDNLLWGAAHATSENTTDEALWEALEVAQAVQVVREKPGALDAEIEQAGKNLSGGQRQRLTIARALVKQSPILILDDSASALDYATEAALGRALKARKGEQTTLIISQRASSVRFADRILVLEHGQLAGNGTHDELMQSCSVYQEIYHSQYPEEAEA